MRSDSLFRLRALLLLGFCLLLMSGRSALAQSQTFTTNTTITATNTTYENYDITVAGCTVTIDGQHTFHSLTLQNGGVVTHDPPSSANFAGGLNLNITTNCTIGVGGSINVVGMGWAGGYLGNLASGPGAGGCDTTGNNGGDGGAYGGEPHGGSDGGPGGTPYDDLTLKTPTDLGSGGGSGYLGKDAGGNGGGAVQLTVGGTLLLNGPILADGQTAANWGGGGSGGSIYLTVGTLTGSSSGLISANGGACANGYGGTGSGGRIAIYYNTNTFASPLTTGGYAIRAGGAKTWWGGYSAAGTVFMQQTNQTEGDLWIHNQGNPNSGAFTPLPDALTFDNVYVWGQGVLASTPGSPLVLNVLSNVTVAFDGFITVTARGYAGGYGPFPAQGPGAGGSDTGGNAGGGGAYGGEAVSGTGANAGSVYDDLTLKTPTDLGSGGGSGSRGVQAGGNGGGAIQMTVGGTLQVNGQLSADGQATTNSGGGGSGGSIYLIVGTLSGSGYISAGGGSVSNAAGSGSGGRIAIYYATNNFATPLSTAPYPIRALGGGGSWQGNYAGAGTVFMQQVGQTQGDLWIHNGGNNESFSYQPEGGATTTPLHDAMTFDDVYVWGQGVLASSPGYPLTLQVLGTLDVGVNGFISALYRGYTGASGSQRAGGPGAGTSDVTGHYGGGGGYGGAGDSGNSGINAGGSTYGSVTMPTDLGSGGGSGVQGLYAGASGGGAIQAIVNGTLRIDGSILADGGGDQNGGGGAGGSIWLVTNTLSGGGLISAGGGGTGASGGGGGGGRIAVYAATNNFTSGTMRAPGGGDNHGNGAAGTVNTYATSGVSLQSLTLTSTTVAEGQATVGSLTLSGPAPTGGVTIVLTPSNATTATIPPSVTVPAGQQGATFPVTANALSAASSVTISASLGGIVQTATLNVKTWISGITLNPAAVPDGVASTGTVTLNFPAPAGGLPVTLATGNTNLVMVGGSVTVPQGKTSATFGITTSGSVATETPVTVTAGYAPESYAATLYIDPSNVALKAFVLTPAIVVGGNVTVGTVSITGRAPVGGAIVALSNSNPGLVNLPATVTIPAGKSSIGFVTSTPQVTTMQAANISATLGAVTKTVAFKVQPTGVATLTLVPNSVQGGVETAVGIVTLQSPVQTSTTVTISSSSNYAIPDTTIVIPAGALTGIFNIDTVTNSTGKPIKATITATANGISAKATLTVN
jgi:hypothetical protein